MKNIPNLHLDILHTTWDHKREGSFTDSKNRVPSFPGVGLPHVLGCMFLGKHIAPLKKGLITKINQSGKMCVFVLGFVGDSYLKK